MDNRIIDRAVVRQLALEEARHYRLPQELLRAWVSAQSQGTIGPDTTAAEWASLAAHYLADLGAYWRAEPKVIERLALAVSRGSANPRDLGRTWAWPGPSVPFHPADVDVESAFRLADMLWTLGVPSRDLLLRCLRHSG